MSVIRGSVKGGKKRGGLWVGKVEGLIVEGKGRIKGGKKRVKGEEKGRRKGEDKVEKRGGSRWEKGEEGQGWE
jgi:hypothetical protein